MIWGTAFGLLTLLSFLLTLWQVWAGRRFPLHRRVTNNGPRPPVTVFKPLKGCDPATAECLRSWLLQDYGAPIQILLGVASPADPVCAVVERLLQEHPGCEARLVICPEALGTNGKVSTLIQLARRARHDLLVISDADVWVPPDLLVNAVAPFHDPAVGLVNCPYQLAQPATLAARWEALGVNADFWSQTLQSQTLWPLDFALGAVMATTRRQLEAIGGFSALADYLADDYQLGHLIAGHGARVVLSPVVVECRSAPLSFRQTWHHQLRWARTIRFCKPLPYVLSVLGNATFWPLLWVLGSPGWASLLSLGTCVVFRMVSSAYLQARLTRCRPAVWQFWLAPVKDLLQFALWALSLIGRRVQWRGDRYRVQKGGKMIKV